MYQVVQADFKFRENLFQFSEFLEKLAFIATYSKVSFPQG